MSKIIHQIWYSNNDNNLVPPAIVRAICSVELWADQIGWEFRLWQNKDIEDLLTRNGIDINEIPSSSIADFNRVGYICDLARWCAVFEYGGLYLDSDIFIVGDGAERDLLSRQILSLPKEKIGTQAYSNAVIWLPQEKDETAKLIISRIIDNFKNRASLANPVHECGPLFITDLLRREGIEIGDLPWERYICFDWPCGCQGGQDTVLFAHVGKGLWGNARMEEALSFIRR